MAGAFVEDVTRERSTTAVGDDADLELVAIFKHYDDDDNGTMDLKECQAALKDLWTVSKRAFENFPAWYNDDDMCDESIAQHIKAFRGMAVEGKEIRIDFPEFSLLATEFVRFSTLSMIETRHKEKYDAAPNLGLSCEDSVVLPEDLPEDARRRRQPSPMQLEP